MASEMKVGAIINYASIVIRLATSFFLTPLVIKFLGAEEYGLFMLSQSVIMWLSLTDFGLGGTVNKYVATYHAKGEKTQEAHFLGQATLLFSALGIFTLFIGSICFFFLGDFFPNLNGNQHDALEIMYLLTLGNLILAFPLRPLGCIPGAYLRFIAPGLVSLALSLLNAGLTVLLLFMGYKAIGLTVMSVAMSVVGLLWGIFYTFRCLGVRIVFNKPDIPLYREMVKFSFWIMLNQLMDLCYWRAGTPILASISGMYAVTLFTIGVSLSMYFMTASTAICGVFNSKLMHMVALEASNDELTQMMIRIGRMQTMPLALILSAYIFYGRPFLQLWVGASIGEGTWLVWGGSLLVMVPLIIPLTQNVGCAILVAKNLFKGRAVILFYSSLLCIVLGASLSYFWGALGMFIGTAVSLIVGQCIMINIYYRRRVGLNVGDFFKKTYLPLAVPLILFAVTGIVATSSFHVSSWADFFVQVAGYCSIGLCILFFLYLNKRERMMVITPLRKIMRWY